MPQRPLSNSEKYVSSQNMAVARINLKNIDYFKFKKLVVDGNRDDYASCSKEVQALCDCVQTLKFRDEEFDDESDRMRFAEICIYYKQILNSKRIESLDMRIKSGWWGDHKNAYSAGKIKPAALKDLLISKAKAWVSRHSAANVMGSIPEKIDGPGLYVFKHKEHQCFQFVGRADRIFSRVGEKLRAAFEGGLTEPLAALLIISMSTDWDFYFIPVGVEDDERVLRVMENDLILKHDCIWPHGLNFRLHIDSLLEVSEFRKSCLRHNWPPEAEIDGDEISLAKLRRQIEMQDEGIMPEVPPEVVETPKKIKRRSKEERPPWEGIVDEPPPPATNGDRKSRGEAFVIPAFDPEPFERPDSPKSDVSSATFVVAPAKVAPPAEVPPAAGTNGTASTSPTSPSAAAAATKSPTKQPRPTTPSSRPTTPARKAPSQKGNIRPLSGNIRRKQVSTPRSSTAGDGGIDRVSSTTSLISNNGADMSPARAKVRMREKDTNAAPAATGTEKNDGSPDNEAGLPLSADRESPDSRSSPTPSDSSGCTYSVDSIERTLSSTSLTSTSETKENEKQTPRKKKPGVTTSASSALKKKESAIRSPRTTRTATTKGTTGKFTRGSDVRRSDGKGGSDAKSRLPVASSGAGGGRHSPSSR